MTSSPVETSADMILPANPTRRRAEEALLIQARLKQLEAKVDTLVEMGAAQAAPAFTEEDASFLAEELASRGTEGLPRGSHMECMAVDTTSPLQRPYGRTYTTICTTVTIFPLNPMTPAEALLCGLLTCSGRLQPTVYERMVKETPGIIEGRLIGPREALLDRQEAGKKARPGLWHA
jgi:hypothetical protein